MIILDKIRIKNFRSIECADVDLGYNNVIIGQNNFGKTNFLNAINISLTNNYLPDDNDIYKSQIDNDDKDKFAIIDIRFVSYNKELNLKEKQFSESWIQTFGLEWIVSDPSNFDYVGIRTIIKYDVFKDRYVSEKYIFKDWGGVDDSNNLIKKSVFFTSDMREYINSYYMDAQRNITQDISNKKSYFNKTISKITLNEEEKKEISQQLDNINDNIINHIDSISEISTILSTIGPTIGTQGIKLEVEPISRNISDLTRGIDIHYQEKNSIKQSVSLQGIGTKSWVSFLTLSAYILYKKRIASSNDIENFVILEMEEPESHLHPQAQRQLYEQLLKFDGQKVISTHSADIVIQADLTDLIHFTKTDGKTRISNFDAGVFDKNELNKLHREVLRTRGDLLFSNCIVLCEGITEEQTLPVYFKEVLGIDPLFKGINIISTGGEKSYQTYVNLICQFNIRWYIYSDGEDLVVKSVEKVKSKTVIDSSAEAEYKFFLPSCCDTERYLIVEGYMEELIQGIKKVHPDFTTEKWSEEDKLKTKPTKQKYTSKIVNLTQNQIEMYDYLIKKGNKASLSLEIAKSIVESVEFTRRVPKIIKEMIFKIARDYKIEVKKEYEDEFNTYTTKNS